VGPNRVTIDGSNLGGGGSDPLLESRVEKLENQAASILTSFSDTFDNESLIDWVASSNVTRVSSGGQTYVAINPLTLTSNANLQTEADGANTTSVSYSAGAVQNVAQTQGVYTSNYYTINASTQASINASYTTPSDNSFSDEAIYTTTGLNQSIINFFTISDADTRWFFYQTTAGYGAVYGWAINTTNGTTVMSHRRIGSAGPSGNLTPSSYRTLSAKIDNSGNVWLACWRYIGGTAGSNSRCAVYKILKNSPTTEAFTDESRALVAATIIGGIDTFYDSTENHFHAAYSTILNGNTAIVIYNGNTNTFRTQNSFTVGTTSSQFSVRLVRSSSASKEVAIFIIRNTTGANSTYGVRYTIDTALTYGAITQSIIMLLGSSNGSSDITFDNTHGFVGINVRSFGASLDLFKIPSNFTTGSTATLINNSAISPAAAAQRISSGVSDGTHFYLSYIANDGIYDKVYTTKMRLTDGSTTSANGGYLHKKVIGTTTIANFDFDQPIMENRSGTVSLFYDKSTGNPSNTVGSVRFGTFAPKLKIEAQMPTGNFIEVFNNDTGYNVLDQNVTLASTKQTQIRFRLTMTSPNASSNVATVSQYTATVPGSNSTGVFVSKSLINNRPIAKVTLSPDLTLGDGLNGIDGTVTFQASNNGGQNWVNVTSGTDYVFSSIGTDLKLKATINIPNDSNGFSPRIQGYSGTAGNIAQQSDLVILNVNLMKTTLQLNTLLTSNRLGWTNMMVDTFQDGTGVTLNGVTLTDGTITGTGTVISAVETSEITTVNSMVVVAESDGTVVYHVSRDGGTTWYIATPNTITVLDGTEATKNQIRIRATMTNATVYGWAYLYA
jgi:hypothetical protein